MRLELDLECSEHALFGGRDDSETEAVCVGVAIPLRAEECVGERPDVRCCDTEEAVPPGGAAVNKEVGGDTDARYPQGVHPDSLRGLAGFPLVVAGEEQRYVCKALVAGTVAVGAVDIGR